MVMSMVNDLVFYVDDKLLPKDGWLRTCVITAGIGTSILYLTKYLLSSRRANCKNNILLTNKTCIITGANTGIGKAVAFEFAKRKGNVILACRDFHKGNTAAFEIKKKIPNASVSVLQLDLSSLDSVREFANQVKERNIKIDILVNNAGLMGCPFTKSVDNIELHFAVNHLGHFLMTNLLLDQMTGNDSRIIVVSSALHKWATMDLVNYNVEEGYNAVQAYGRSKLANLMFTHELAKKLPSGITVNAMHPGMVWTDLGRYRLNNIFSRALFGFAAYFLIRTPKEGAETIIYMATEPSLKDYSGCYFGDCQIETFTEAAKDDKVCEKLWELSEQLTNSKK